MRTTMQAHSTSLSPTFTVGDVVYIAKLGMCKVREAFARTLVVADPLGALYEVEEVIQASQKARKGKHEQQRGKFV